MARSIGHSSFPSTGRTDPTRVTAAGGSHTSILNRRSSLCTKDTHRSCTTTRLLPLYDPMRVVTAFQLQAFELLDTTPVWVFDFVQRSNRWANASGLKLWNAPSLQEFVDRDMTDMSETAILGTQKCHDLISSGQKVQDTWTFYPKGKAKTVAVTVTAMRMSEEEDHCSMICFGKTVKILVPKRGTSSATASYSSSRSCGTKSKEEDMKNLYKTDVHVQQEQCSNNLHLPDPLQAFPSKNGQLSLHDSTVSSNDVSVEGKSIVCHNLDPNYDKIDEELDLCRQSNPLYMENFREADILRYLPTAVCMFDIEGRAIYQNPASYLPEQSISEDSLSGSSMQVAESREEGRKGPEKSHNDSDGNVEGLPLSFGDENGFIRRFVDPKLARSVLNKMSDESTSFTSLNIEAELYTNQRGKTQWSAIQLRKTLDPVTGKSVFLFSSLDRSDAIEAEKERKARIEETEFLAIMAHEIRTPLHQVIGFIDLLECTCVSRSSPEKEVSTMDEEDAEPYDAVEKPNSCNLSDEQRGYVKLLRSSATQLMTVINDVLDYSKLEAGQMKIECIPFEPMSVVKGSMAAMQASCQEKGLCLTLDYGESQYEIGTGSPFSSKKGYSIIPFRILGDPNRLRQVLSNLLSNAIKFTSTGGIHVQVSSNMTGIGGVDRVRWIRFVVTDTGTGISEANQATVFQKYQQASASDARIFGGTGLGLSICQSLVHKMGGTIGVDSQLGVGSSFWFSLPIETSKVANEVLKQEIEEKDDVGSNIPMNILVVEDNKINQKLMDNMLKRLGHHVILVGNGEEAISAIKTLQKSDDSSGEGDCTRPTCCHSFFDAVLMDIQMPIMDGLEATRRLRHMGYTDLLILGLTASQKRSDFKDLGFDDWLPKPILIKELKSKLRHFCNLSRKTGDVHLGQP
ncbi:PAS domain containing protein [Nitzschia inconspicua]|uniref:histidine kinase n=1 Tax=Nitzschia inconspicua TaxID=303405 RepID=A0A9K3LP92_9STRA|nr:PAS domain containing protein [Nitzschia inconspicua]